MSPGKAVVQAPPRVELVVQRIASDAGHVIRNARLRRGWRLKDLAARARMSASAVQGVEVCQVASLEAYAPAGRRARLNPGLTSETDRPTRQVRDLDPVHAAMGEIEAVHLRAATFEVLLDEPYQHYQFAGRADVVAIDRTRCDLLHLENRTRFPDILDRLR